MSDEDRVALIVLIAVIIAVIVTIACRAIYRAIKKDQTQNLRGELIKIVVDKLLTVAILLIVGIYATTVTNRFLSKARIDRIGEVWSKIDLRDDQLSNDLKVVNRLPNSDGDAKHSAAIQAYQSARSLNSDAKRSLAQNRFWIAEDIYSDLSKYLDDCDDFLKNKLDHGDTTGTFGKDMNDRREELRKIVRLRDGGYPQ